jgi:uncharacterized phage-associated protein
MHSDYNAEKALQAFAYLLARHPERKANYYNVLKMLYVADRESMKERGTVISTDTHVAFEAGPSLSKTYYCIKGQTDSAKRFGEFVQHIKVREVRLLQSPSTGALSKAELRKLDQVFEKFKDFTEKQWEDYTHQFEEWKKNDPRSTPEKRTFIQLEDLIDAVGMREHKEEILNVLKARKEVDQVLGK